MKSPFHSLTDFEMGNQGQPVEAPPPPPASRRKSQLLTGLPVAPDPVPSKPASPPPSRRSRGFVTLEDRVTRAVKAAVATSLKLEPREYRMRKERCTDPDGWRVSVDARHKGIAGVLVFEIVGTAEEVSLRLDLETAGKARAKLGKGKGPTTQESLDEMCLKAMRLVTAGLVR